MPIDLKKFREQSDLTAEEEVTFFLFFRDKAYTAEELSQRLDRPRGTINHALSDLKKQDIVVNKTPNWAIEGEEAREEATKLLKENDVLNRTADHDMEVELEGDGQKTIQLKIEWSRDAEVERLRELVGE